MSSEDQLAAEAKPAELEIHFHEHALQAWEVDVHEGWVVHEGVVAREVLNEKRARGGMEELEGGRLGMNHHQ